MHWQVYALIDPRTQKIRYVGWTSRKMADRISRHKTEASKKTADGAWFYRHHRANWMRELLRAKAWPPKYQILEVGEGATWAPIEQRWIKDLRDRGELLVNSTDGGEGTPGHAHPSRPWSEEDRAKARQRAVDLGLSEAMRENWRNNPGMYKAWMADETKRKQRSDQQKQYIKEHPEYARQCEANLLRAAQTYWTPERRKAQGQRIRERAKQGPRHWKLTEEQLADIATTCKSPYRGMVQDLAQRCNVHRKTIRIVIKQIRTTAPDLQAQYTAPGQHSPSEPALVAAQPQPTASRTATP